MTTLPRRIAAGALGSALLAAIVIGSGIAAARLSPRDTGLQLLKDAVATGFELFVLVLVFLYCSSWGPDNDNVLDGAHAVGSEGRISASNVSIRVLMLSRMARTSSMPLPAGSTSSQSS